MPRLLLQLTIVAALAVAAWLYAPPLGAVSPETLQHSLARELGGDLGAGGECRRRLAGTWRCAVRDAAVSGDVEYELVRRGRRCWSASQVEPGRSPSRLPVRGSACAGMRDQVRLEQRL